MTTITKTKQQQPGGLHGYMVKWNELAAQAAALGGIKGVKPHTSEFESYTKAQKRVMWLEEQIAALMASVKVPAVLTQVAAKVAPPAKASKSKRESGDGSVGTVSDAPAVEAEPAPETAPAPKAKRQRKPRANKSRKK